MTSSAGTPVSSSIFYEGEVRQVVGRAVDVGLSGQVEFVAAGAFHPPLENQVRQAELSAVA